jgi:hypothetical protein
MISQQEKTADSNKGPPLTQKITSTQQTAAPTPPRPFPLFHSPSPSLYRSRSHLDGQPGRPTKRTELHYCYNVVALLVHCYYIYGYNTVVTLLLHCCCAVVALMLHCFTLFLHFCHTVVALLAHYCYTGVTLVLHCCCTLGTLLLHF